MATTNRNEQPELVEAKILDLVTSCAHAIDPEQISSQLQVFKTSEYPK